MLTYQKKKFNSKIKIKMLKSFIIVANLKK